MAPHSPVTQRRGGGGRGQIRPGPRPGCRRGVHCSSRDSSQTAGGTPAAFWREAGAWSPRSAGARVVATPLRPSVLSSCQMQRAGGGGGQRVPPRPLPTKPKWGGRRGNLGSSGPPFEQSLPQALSCRKRGTRLQRPLPHARGVGLQSRRGAESTWTPRRESLGCGSGRRLPRLPRVRPRDPGWEGQGRRPRRRARARTHRLRSRAARAAAGPRAPRSGRIAGRGAQGALRRRPGCTSPKRGAGTSSRREAPGPPCPACPAPRSAASAPHAPLPHRPA